jgi:hypothetical protein
LLLGALKDSPARDCAFFATSSSENAHACVVASIRNTDAASPVKARNLGRVVNKCVSTYPPDGALRNEELSNKLVCWKHSN